MKHTSLMTTMGRLVVPTLLVPVVCLSLAWAQENPKGENREIMAVGTGLVTDGNVARARTAAVADALNKGIEQYLVQRLGTQGMIINFSTLMKGMVSGENQEIEHFNILAEERVDKHYNVLVRLRVNEGVMEERFREKGVTLLNHQLVKLVFLVSQVERPGNRISYWWKAPEEGTALTATEVVLHRVFEDFGFSSVNRLMQAPGTKYTAEMTGPDLSSEDALRWGEVLSVPVVIQGRCDIKVGKEISVSLTALDTQKRSIIDQGSQNEVVEPGADGVGKAVEKAVRRLAVRLCPSIRKAIDVQETRANRIEVFVKGLRSFRELKAVREFLEREVRGVRSVRQNKLGKDFAGLTVEFSGDRQEFLNRVSRQFNVPFVTEEGSAQDDAVTLRMK